MVATLTNVKIFSGFLVGSLIITLCFLFQTLNPLVVFLIGQWENTVFVHYNWQLHQVFLISRCNGTGPIFVKFSAYQISRSVCLPCGQKHFGVKSQVWGGKKFFFSFSSKSVSNLLTFWKQNVMIYFANLPIKILFSFDAFLLI